MLPVLVSLIWGTGADDTVVVILLLLLLLAEETFFLLPPLSAKQNLLRPFLRWTEVQTFSFSEAFSLLINFLGQRKKSPRGHWV